MATCMMCKKDVTSGFVVCGKCAGELNAETMPLVLAGYTAWLGSELVQNDTVNFCSVCKGGNCDDLPVCRKGVTAWFREKAREFMEAQ